MKTKRFIAVFLLGIIILITALPLACFAVTIIDIENRDGVFVGECFSCGEVCEYVIGHEWWTKQIHCIRHWCSNCGFDQNMGTYAEKHLMIGKECYWCGYPVRRKDLNPQI